MANNYLAPVVLFFAAMIVWGVANFMQPFGEPLPVWHILNFAVVVVSIYWFMRIRVLEDRAKATN